MNLFILFAPVIGSFTYFTLLTLKMQLWCGLPNWKSSSSWLPMNWLLVFIFLMKSRLIRSLLWGLILFIEEDLGSSYSERIFSYITSLQSYSFYEWSWWLLRSDRLSIKLFEQSSLPSDYLRIWTRWTSPVAVCTSKPGKIYLCRHESHEWRFFLLRVWPEIQFKQKLHRT